jgi:hypothetical protein
MFLLCWVPFSGFVVLDSFMSGYGALSSYSGFAVTLQLCFFALSLLGALFPAWITRILVGDSARFHSLMVLLLATHLSLSSLRQQQRLASPSWLVSRTLASDLYLLPGLLVY